MIVYKELYEIEAELGIPLKTLYGVSNNIPRHYREVSIPKADGGKRILSVPDEPLKRIQRAIARRLLAAVPVSSCAKAYKPGGSVRQNAACHVGKERLLKLDIYRFFDSISYSAVKERVFSADRYSEPIRILLSMLCYRGDVLPQGAPTSPLISNIILCGFDKRVGEWCEERGIGYTRYCDDMTFSGCFREDEVVAFVAGELKQEGFVLNERKTRCLGRGSKKTVTGVVVNQKINAEKAYRREIRQAVYYCRKFGVPEHLRSIGSTQEPSRYLAALLGKVNYVLQLTPENREFVAYRKQVTELIKKLSGK